MLPLEVETLDHLGNEVYFRYIPQDYTHNHYDESLHTANVANRIVPACSCYNCVVLVGVKTQSDFDKWLACNKWHESFCGPSDRGRTPAVIFIICVFDEITANK